MTVRFRPREARSGDDGFALVTVLGVMLVVTLLVAATLAAVTREVRPSRRAQDFQSAMAAAQAGLEDFVSRLNACDTYWRAPCGSSATDAALVTSANPNPWEQVPGTTGSASPEFYQYAVVTPPLKGLLQVRVTGKANGVKRTITADLRRDGLLNMIYFTNYETLAPALYPLAHPAGEVFSPPSTSTTTAADGTTTSTTTRIVYTTGIAATDAAACEKYYWAGRGNVRLPARQLQQQTWNATTNTWDATATAYVIPTCDLINFTANDKLAGRVHSNDAFSINGAVRFQSLRATDLVGTSWSSTATVRPPDPNRPWITPSISPDMSCSGCMLPTYEKPLTLPADNQSVANYADPRLGGQGCLYTGPTQLTFNSDGSISVRSPNSSNPALLNAACGSAADLAQGLTVSARPQNGVVYVQAAPAASASSIDLGFVRTSAESPYSGDAFVSGTVSGSFTVAAQNDVNIVGNTVYSSGTTPTSTDVLGLIGNGFVQIYHPVDASGNTLPSGSFTMPDGTPGIEVDAALLSVQGSITTQNYTQGDQLGALRVFGTLAQKFRGPVGSSDASGTRHGYLKDYRYDARLVTQPPPFFLDPTSSQWQVQALGEQANP